MKKWTERLAAAALAAILLVSPAFAAGGRFSDVPEDYWGYAHIEQAAAQGWVNGNGDGTFSPDRELSGAAVCAMLSNLLGREVDAGGNWQLAHMEAARELGLLEGTRFLSGYSKADGWSEQAISAPLTRYDMAVIVYNLGSADLDGFAMPKLTDAQLTQARSGLSDYESIPKAYRQAVTAVCAAGIASGQNDGAFHGEDSLTRAQACVFLVNIHEKMGTGSASTQLEPDADGEYTARVIKLVNEERAKQGLAPLEPYERLQKAAQVRAVEIVGKFSHTRPDGTGFQTAVEQAGGAMSNISMVGENIAAGYSSPEAVVEGWMNSPGHRANILEAEFTHIGVGYEYLPGTTYKYYWSQEFAAVEGG